LCNFPNGSSELFRDLLERLKEFGKFDFLNFVLHDPARNVMRLNVLEALIPITIPVSLELPIADSPAGWVWKNQKPLLLSDLAIEKRFGKYVRLLNETLQAVNQESKWRTSAKRRGRKPDRSS
jgi:formate hydrogenlyase transcriptional activator